MSGLPIFFAAVRFIRVDVASEAAKQWMKSFLENLKKAVDSIPIEQMEQFTSNTQIEVQEGQLFIVIGKRDRVVMYKPKPQEHGLLDPSAVTFDPVGDSASCNITPSSRRLQRPACLPDAAEVLSFGVSSSSPILSIPELASVKLDVLAELIVKIGSISGTVIFSTLMRTSCITEAESEVEQGALDTADKTIVNTSAASNAQAAGSPLSTSNGCCLAHEYATYNDSENSMAVRGVLNIAMEEELLRDGAVLIFGEAKVERKGRDLTIVTHSKMVIHSMDAADLLAKEGINAEIINFRGIYVRVGQEFEPVAQASSLVNHHCLLVVEGGFPAFGVGSAICAQIVEREASENLDAPVERVTGVDVPTPFLAFPGLQQRKEMVIHLTFIARPTFVKALVALICTISANRDSKGDENCENLQKDAW
ncbi:uncharacterized protein BJ212DRAFT_1588454 [Suillus subaureus]|uniref:Pyruvate dehydrogenase E1 component subunit beta n=1 Tax=Suillus subaureus TaxID=48587 RepID=A0A9P7E7W5_9AGAM|nr:uncharacterized protein BJ212DRAFT_1588454 [Suillus subaureus]KAG1813869.1 hypothetical protein BJ212DRAFT_1588454 [Suillus subaureus]